MTAKLPDPDQPEEEAFGLVVPFIVCKSEGGPYDDEAFVVGFQAGQIDKELAVAATMGVTSAQFTVHTAILKQLELIGMNRGFPTMHVGEFDPDEIGHDCALAVNETWAPVTFVREGAVLPAAA